MIHRNDANNMALDRYGADATFSCFKFFQILHSFLLILKITNSDLSKKDVD
jgi:hypothetical protein